MNDAAASPPDVRKGCAFPFDVVDYLGGYASNPRRSLELSGLKVARKARGFPHIGRQSRRTQSTCNRTTPSQLTIASRSFFRDNPCGASVNCWPGATVCAAPFQANQLRFGIPADSVAYRPGIGR